MDMSLPSAEAALGERRVDIAAYQRGLSEKLAKADTFAATATPIEVVAGDAVHRIASSAVDFVEDLPAITPVPGKEPFVLGVCRVRGRVLYVLDLATALSAPRRQGARIIAFKGRDVALVAPLASIKEKTSLRQADFQPAVFGSGYLSHLQ